MKNSAWYNKLWRKKLKKLHLQEDRGKAWADMSKILDQHMPVNHTTGGKTSGGKPFKPVISKIVSLLGYVLPAAAMVCSVTYFVVKQPDVKALKEKKHPIVPVERIYSLNPGQSQDSLDKILAAGKKFSTEKLTGGTHNNNYIAPTAAASLQKTNNPNVVSHENFQKNGPINKEEPINNNSAKLASLQIADTVANSQNKTESLSQIPQQTAKNTQSKISKQKLARQRKTAKKRNSLNGKINNESPDYATGFNYGIKAGYSFNNASNNIYFGVFSSFEIDKHWYFSPELIVNTARAVSGSYSHPGYFRPDSLGSFGLTDSRKIYIIDIPLNIKYKVSKIISLKAGPVFSIPIKQTAILSKVGYVPNQSDTVRHTKDINAALSRTILKPKFNIGISAGIGIQLKRFNIEARYQQSLTPYKVSSDLGDYKFNSHSFLFGIGFQLNKRRSD